MSKEITMKFANPVFEHGISQNTVRMGDKWFNLCYRQDGCIDSVIRATDLNEMVVADIKIINASLCSIRELDATSMAFNHDSDCRDIVGLLHNGLKPHYKDIRPYTDVSTIWFELIRCHD